MTPIEESKKLLEDVIRNILLSWYERVKPHYVTVEDSQQLGVEPELKYFDEESSYRLKFARLDELDVTYGLTILEQEGQLIVASSVNNKSSGLDLGSFMEKLKAYYWRSRNEMPWTHAYFDRFTYEDLMPFEPLLGETVYWDVRESKADIVRLQFRLNPRHVDQLLKDRSPLRDLIENYCLYPLRRIYAESYRQKS